MYRDLVGEMVVVEAVGSYLLGGRGAVAGMLVEEQGMLVLDSLGEEGSFVEEEMVGSLVAGEVIVVVAGGMRSERTGWACEREVVGEDSSAVDMAAQVVGRGWLGGCCFGMADRAAVAVEGIDVDLGSIAEVGYRDIVAPWVTAKELNDGLLENRARAKGKESSELNRQKTTRDSNRYLLSSLDVEEKGRGYIKDDTRASCFWQYSVQCAPYIP